MRKQKIFFAIIALMCFAFSFSSMAYRAAPNSGLNNSNSYSVGNMNNLNNNDSLYDMVKNSFVNEYNNFKNYKYTGMPSSYVSRTGDYYVQNFNDANNQRASIYVGPGPGYKAYTVNNPMYGVLNSVGGINAVGYPTSNAFKNNGKYYQNFSNGYVSSNYGSNTGTFVRSKQIDQRGRESLINSTSVPRLVNNTGNNNTWFGQSTLPNTTNNTGFSQTTPNIGNNNLGQGQVTPNRGNFNTGLGQNDPYGRNNLGDGVVNPNTRNNRTGNGLNTPNPNNADNTRYNRNINDNTNFRVNPNAATTPIARTPNTVNDTTARNTGIRTSPTMALITLLIIGGVIALIIVLATRKGEDK